MGLEFKTFNTLASRMSFAKISGLGQIGSSSKSAAKAPAVPKAASPAASPATSPAASPATPKAAHPAACRYGSRCTGCHLCRGGKGGKGGKHDGGVTDAINAMEANIKGHIDSRLEAAQAAMASSFSKQEQTLHGLHQAVAQSQLATQQSFQALANAMATAISGGQRQLPSSSVSRQIGDGQNTGWGDTANGSRDGAATSFRPSRSIENDRTTVRSQHGCQNDWSDGQHMSKSSSYFPPQTSLDGSFNRPPADQRFSTSGSGHSAHVPQSLAELIPKIPENLNGFLGLVRRIISDAASPGAKPVPQFTFHKVLFAWQMSGGNDDLACALMAATYGKPLSQQRLQSGIDNALKTTDIGVFKEFFRRISAMYPSYVLTYKWKGTGQEIKTSYGTFSSDQDILWRFIHEHLLM